MTIPVRFAVVRRTPAGTLMPTQTIRGVIPIKEALFWAWMEYEVLDCLSGQRVRCAPTYRAPLPDRTPGELG